jgi:hypothetical protein
VGGGWWEVVVGVEGNFSVSFGPKPGFRLWLWFWPKLNNNYREVYFQFGLFIRNIKLALLLLQQGIESQQNYIQA